MDCEILLDAEIDEGRYAHVTAVPCGAAGAGWETDICERYARDRAGGRCA